MLHAAADVDREHEIERRVLAHQAGDVLLDAVLDDFEIVLLQSADELAAVRDDHRHQHGVGANAARCSLRSLVMTLSFSWLPSAKRGDNADVVVADDVAGIEPADERGLFERAGESAVHRERDRLHGRHRGLRLDASPRDASGRSRPYRDPAT